MSYEFIMPSSVGLMATIIIAVFVIIVLCIIIKINSKKEEKSIATQEQSDQNHKEESLNT